MWWGVAVVGVAIKDCHAMQLCRSRLRKGRDWLMWALLYFSSTVQSKASQPALVFQKEFVPILNLFSLLYQDREVRRDGGVGVWPALPGQGGMGCGLLYQDREGWGMGQGGMGCGLLYQDREVRMDGVWPALMGQGGKEGWGCGLLYQDREVRMDGGVACSTRTGRGGVWPALPGQGGKDGWGVACSNGTGVSRGSRCVFS